MEFVLIIVALGAFIVFQTIQGRKRKRETTERQQAFVPGVEIMTNYGLYGTILTMDDETNVVEIESTPGTVLKIHRQTILKVADYAVVAETEADDETEIAADDAASDTAEPKFGQRVVEPAKPKTDSPSTEV